MAQRHRPAAVGPEPAPPSIDRALRALSQALSCAPNAMRTPSFTRRLYLAVPLNARTHSIGSLCLSAYKPAAFDAGAASRLGRKVVR